MFYFGVDWGETTYRLRILNEAGARVSQITFERSPRGLEQVEAEQRKLGVPTSECPLAIETAHDLLVDYLLERGYPLYIIPPHATDGYRNRQRHSGAHDDASDAALLASILRTDHDSQRRWLPNQPLTQQMLIQVRLIETLRRSRQRQENQLRAVLLRAYPQALDLFGDLTAQISLQFLSVYPSAAEAKTLSAEAFQAFCQEHGYKRADLITHRYAHLSSASVSVPSAVGQAYRETVRSLADVLLPQVRCRLQALRQLDALFPQHPDAFIFESLPNAGVLLAPALLVKFGDQRERFPTPAAVQALAGSCPVTEGSGKKHWVHFRHGCDHEFRHIAQQYARLSRSASGWAEAYWQESRPRCDSDAHADRLLANRWLAIIWKLWQTRQAYDEAYHAQQRAQRRQPKA